MVGEGFVRDVLGARAENLESFDTLAAAGFWSKAVGDAERHLHGSGAVAGEVFPSADQIAPSARLAMIACLERATGAPSLHRVQAGEDLAAMADCAWKRTVWACTLFIRGAPRRSRRA